GRGEGAMDRARAHGGRSRCALPRQPRHAGAAVRKLRHARELRLCAGARSQRGAPALHGKERCRRSGAAQRGSPAARAARTLAQPPPDQSAVRGRLRLRARGFEDRKSTRLNSSHEWISYAVFCLKKKKKKMKETVSQTRKTIHKIR